MMRTAEAIVPPGPPTALTATAIGTTVVLTWTPPTNGGTPTSYVIQAGSATGLNNLADFDMASALPTLTATPGSPASYLIDVGSSAGGSTFSGGTVFK
jgi:hypothetical protein